MGKTIRRKSEKMLLADEDTTKKEVRIFHSDSEKVRKYPDKDVKVRERVLSRGVKRKMKNEVMRAEDVDFFIEELGVAPRKKANKGFIYS